VANLNEEFYTSWFAAFGKDESSNKRIVARLLLMFPLSIEAEELSEGKYFLVLVASSTTH